MKASVWPFGDHASASRPPAGSMLRTLVVVISSAGAASSVRRTTDAVRVGCRQIHDPAPNPATSATTPTISAGVSLRHGDRETLDGSGMDTATPGPGIVRPLNTSAIS